VAGVSYKISTVPKWVGTLIIGEILIKVKLAKNASNGRQVSPLFRMLHL